MTEWLTDIVSLVHVEIGVQVSLMSTPDCSRHARPGLLERKNSLYIVSREFFAGNRIYDDGFNTKEGERSRPWFCRSYSCQRSNYMRACLGLPICLICVSAQISKLSSSGILISQVFRWEGEIETLSWDTYVYNLSLTISNHIVIPFPDLRRNWLAD